MGVCGWNELCSIDGGHFKAACRLRDRLVRPVYDPFRAGLESRAEPPSYLDLFLTSRVHGVRGTSAQPTRRDVPPGPPVIASMLWHGVPWSSNPKSETGWRHYLPWKSPGRPSTLTSSPKTVHC